MDKEEIISKINNKIQNTMTSNIGIEVIDYDDDFICGKMPVDERTMQPQGLLHGGASVALAETLGSIGGGIKVKQWWFLMPPYLSTGVESPFVLPSSMNNNNDGYVRISNCCILVLKDPIYECFMFPT